MRAWLRWAAQQSVGRTKPLACNARHPNGADLPLGRVAMGSGPDGLRVCGVTPSRRTREVGAANHDRTLLSQLRDDSASPLICCAAAGLGSVRTVSRMLSHRRVNSERGAQPATHFGDRTVDLLDVAGPHDERVLPLVDLPKDNVIPCLPRLLGQSDGV